MNAVTLSKRALYFPCIAFSLLIVTACTTVDEGPITPPNIFNGTSSTAEILLRKADQADAIENIKWQLAAVQALTQERKYDLAESLIEHLQKKALTAKQRNDLGLLIAENQYSQNKLSLSLQSLANINPDLFSTKGNLHYLKLKVEIYVRKKDHQAASDALLALVPLLDQDEIQHFNDLLFMQLVSLSPETLNKFQTSNLTLSGESKKESLGDGNNSLAQRLAEIEAEMNANTAASQLSDEDIFIQGWYSLANFYQRYQLRTNQLLRSIDTWKSTYPTHPLLQNMPTPLKNISETSPYRPAKIAVLLPISGRFAKQAQALQYGISDAFYNQIKLHKKLKIEEDALRNNIARLSEDHAIDTSDINTAKVESDFDFPHPSLMFYDTNSMTMQAIADDLHAKNIDFIIGPLLKPNLEKFLPLVEDIPALMLNALPAKEDISSLHYSFLLSPEGEAEQAAELIFQNKHKKPLILAPKSNFGSRVANAFEARWNQLNSKQQTESESSTQENYPAETHYFTSKAKLARFIDNTMQTNQSKQRIAQMKEIIDKPVKTEVRSRRDVDAIYLVSNRSELILLKPFIAVSISQFAKRIPIYASSRSHDADLTGKQNKELTSLIFSDVTFLMDDKNQINKDVQAIWPKQRFSTLRLFALGYDSYNLIEQLKKLQMIDSYYFEGLTGELTLDERNTLKTKLQWAKYQRGSLVEVTPPTTSK